LLEVAFSPKIEKMSKLCYHYDSILGVQIMPSVLVRDVDVSTLKKLKLKAAREGRSLQAEVQIILDRAVESEPLSELETARKIRSALGAHEQTDSAKLLREDRRR
jgi:plasmid stability protein